MLKNSQEKIIKPVQKKEFECNVYYLMRNSCSRCPKNRECEESDRDDINYKSDTTNDKQVHRENKPMGISERQERVSEDSKVNDIERKTKTTY